MTTDSDTSPDMRKPPRCAICGKPQDNKYSPFCSKRCADIDLSRWLKGVYVIPAEESDQPGPESSFHEDR